MNRGCIERMMIRRATIEDAAALAEFNMETAMETEAMEILPEVAMAGVKTMIENPQMGFYLVAEADSAIQASLMITVEWSDWRNGLFWWIQSVYVEPQYRRRGLYRKLYQQVKSLAATEDNVCGFRLYVEQDNQVAQQAYRALNMKVTDYRLYEELKTETGI
jgi:ribosomal protein S18 acetylase RimI-like enzyme